MTKMSWGQNLVNASVSVNRAIFEMNKPGRMPGEKPNEQYIITEIESAISDLNNSLALLKEIGKN